MTNPLMPAFCGSPARDRINRAEPGAEMRLMEAIVSRENMMTAYQRVMANKGAPAGAPRRLFERRLESLFAPLSDMTAASGLRSVAAIRDRTAAADVRLRIGPNACPPARHHPT